MSYHGTPCPPGDTKKEAEPVSGPIRIREWERLLSENTVASKEAIRTVFAQAGEETPDLLVTLLGRSLRACREAKVHLRMLLFFTLMVFALVCAWIACSPESRSLFGALAIPVWLLFPFYPAWYDSYRAERQRLRNIVFWMHDYGSLKGIGKLIAAMQIGDSVTNALASSALVALLPHLQREEAGLLDKRHRTYLYRILQGYDVVLILVVLETLARIGDIKAIPHVQRLTMHPLWLAESAQIRKAAEVCLAQLHKWSAKQQVAQTLLRPASTSAPQAEILLRAVQEQAVSEAGNLLRSELQSQERLWNG